MKRALAALAVAVLAVALVASGRPTTDAHAATTCSTHAKRIVKHVKRHGKRKRVVQIKRYRVCKPASAPESAAPTPITPAPAPTPTLAPVTTAPPIEPVDPGPAPTPEPQPEPEANALGVAADDHGGVKSYTLSRRTVRSGRLTVQLQNKGEDPHDMEMQKVGPGGEPLGEPVEVPVTGPGEQKTQSVTVEPGTYRMWCNLREHAKEGMEATVTVE
jgi:plastocyanin